MISKWTRFLKFFSSLLILKLLIVIFYPVRKQILHFSTTILIYSSIHAFNFLDIFSSSSMDLIGICVWLFKVFITLRASYSLISQSVFDINLSVIFIITVLLEIMIGYCSYWTLTGVLMLTRLSPAFRFISLFQCESIASKFEMYIFPAWTERFV